MAPLPDAILSLLPRALSSAIPSNNVDARSLSPMDVHDMSVQKRAAAPNFDPSTGVKPATDFNNKGFQALFALLGMGMVLTGIWFFFWAKNGGFKWREGDWEDYKSTVLRRKGPDGRTLSNATKSTKLGGGSVVHGGSYGAGTVAYTDETGTSADFSEMREVEEGHGRGFGLRGGDARKKHRREKQTSKDPELAEYRQEKAARVGGLNRAADGVYADYSVTQSEVSQHSKAPLTGKPKDKKKDAKDKKKEEAAKKERAKARMREAKRQEKENAKNKAAEAKAAKVADKKAKAEEKKAKKTAKPSEPAESVAEPSTKPSHRAPPSAAYSFTNGDDATTHYTGEYTEYTADRTAPSEHNESSYYSDYRPNADPSAFNNNNHARRSHNSTPRRGDRESRRSESHSRQGSPRKHHRSSRPPQSEFGTSAVTDHRGNNSYPCHIPGLSSAGSVGVSESVSQVGAPPRRQQRDVMDGYRRGGVRTVGRRDSLSDSDA